MCLIINIVPLLMPVLIYSASLEAPIYVYGDRYPKTEDEHVHDTIDRARGKPAAADAAHSDQFGSRPSFGASGGAMFSNRIERG